MVPFALSPPEAPNISPFPLHFPSPRATGNGLVKFRDTKSWFLMSNILAWDDFLCVWPKAQVSRPVAFFHWFQDTWLPCEVVWSSRTCFPELESTHFPLCYLVGVTQMEQMALHLPPLVNQPLGINIKMTPTTSFVQGNKKQSGHYSQEFCGWTGSPFALQLKRCAWHF